MNLTTKKPLVSIIIPLFNQSKYIGEAIKSALHQTYKDIEIIVIDDGSTDNSREVVAQFGEQVHYIWQENKGLGGARNTGIYAAKGEFVGLLDADDYWLPNFLEGMLELADQNPEAIVYFCCAQSMDESSRDLPQVYGRLIFSQDDIYNAILRSNFIIPSTVILRREAVISMGLFEQDNRYIHGCEDLDLWLRLLKEYEFIGISDCLIKYRLHDDALSTNTTQMQQAMRSVIEKHFGMDDGNLQTWSPRKRRAFGGVYRYYALTSAQRQNDWQAAGYHFRKGLIVDSSLSSDMDFFYDLVHTGQPFGYRGTSYRLDFESNVVHIRKLLENVFNANDSSELTGLRHLTYSSANFALGLVAYQVGKYRDARNHMFSAIKFNIDLIRDKRAIVILMKSFLGESVLNIVRNLRRLAYDQGRN